MEKDSVKDAPAKHEPEEKKTTRFDRRLNWLKDHPVISWVMLFAVVVSIGWGLIPRPWKDAINGQLAHIKKSEKSETDHILEIAKTYFADLADGKFNAKDYFAPHIDKYFLVTNLTPDQVDDYYRANSLEFLSPKSEILDSTFSCSRDPNGDRTVNFWVKFTCFRKAKNKYEYCLSREEFVFDKNDKIRSLYDLQYKNLRFFNKEILLEGSVGKLPAVFHLTFDYENKKITGSYYYPSRPNANYSIEGTISGTKITLAEFTKGVKTATCVLTTGDNLSFTGTMSNKDGRQLKMVMRSSEPLFL